MASEDESGQTPGGQAWAEQYADVIELIGERISRAPALATGFAQRRPYLAAAIVAALLGAIVGLILAGRRAPRRAGLPVVPRPWARRRARLAPSVPPPARGALDQAGAALALVPLTMRLLANPLVRQVLFRMIVRALRGRRGA